MAQAEKTGPFSPGHSAQPRAGRNSELATFPRSRPGRRDAGRAVRPERTGGVGTGGNPAGTGGGGGHARGGRGSGRRTSRPATSGRRAGIRATRKTPILPGFLVYSFIRPRSLPAAASLGVTIFDIFALYRFQAWLTQAI